MKREYGKCWNMHYAIGHLIVITSSNLWQDVIPKNQSNGRPKLEDMKLFIQAFAASLQGDMEINTIILLMLLDTKNISYKL